MLNSVLFCSRNKDNQQVENFKERRKAFLVRGSLADNFEELNKKFEDFSNDGVDGEVSRFYFSVNERNEEKTKRALMVFMLQNPDFPLEKLPQKVVSVADQPENALTKRWLFDFDENNNEKLEQFLKFFPNEYNVYKTKNGFAVVTSKGFDIRPVLDWVNKTGTDVTLKKDSKLLVKWG